MWFGVISKFLINISRNFILVEFGKIFRLVELSRFLRCKVDVNGNFRLVDPGRFFRF